MRNIVRAAMAATVLLVPLADAGAAHADSTSVGVSDSSRAVAAGVVSPMGTVSTALSSGTLTFTATPGSEVSGNSSLSYVSISYKKNSGSEIEAEFLYQTGGVSHWQPTTFLEDAGQTKSYSWGGVGVSCSFIGGMWVSGQQTFLTPATSGC